ncbi:MULTISPECIES: hypothetical protein [Pseudanabaena]|uniref:Uncharacterized protein n=2 Tax=Pseudanabaena TaxID=1152 RepID=L8MYC3_9CYAN|nr:MULTISPECIES: hypothetical protein [Pseudanabaena]ELS32486.1 hypothetical protein Pse7429DRAFT_2359 [Pseudanabaena biceps PCC 7429]MDG3495267.1 hypothetical protein [Pseudanabaena catenata USMAC16]TYQ23693.1 hypothetical protein PseudUWO310_21945 [Pseudanabaena sp. UWO310]
MTVNVSESLFEQILEYLRARTAASDRVAQNLLKTLEKMTSSSSSIDSATKSNGDRIEDLAPQFGQKLFEAWKELADLQVGENYWSYPVMFEDLAETMEISVDLFVQYLANVQIGSLQLIQGRGYNYQVNGNAAASLTFHSAPTLKKAAIPHLADKKQGMGIDNKPLGKTFKVGDRVAVNANRQQYANHKGVVEQVISVSCRVKLDNGWTAFLPNHCLDRI